MVRHDDMWTDSHCHLDNENLPDGPDDVLARAAAANVSRLVAVGVGRGGAALREVRALAEAQSGVWFSAGIHPHDAMEATADERALVEEALGHPRCVALGEVGLDYYYESSPRPEQIALFRELIDLAIVHEKPLMLHVREAHQEALELLTAVRGRFVPSMVHCFTAGPDIARAYLDLGFYLSIPGILTFKTATLLAEVVRQAPRDRIVLETDSPFLAPVPLRGKKNEPSFLPLVGRKVAELWQLPEAEVARITSVNASRLFGLRSETS